MSSSSATAAQLSCYSSSGLFEFCPKVELDCWRDRTEGENERWVELAEESGIHTVVVLGQQHQWWWEG